MFYQVYGYSSGALFFAACALTTAQICWAAVTLETYLVAFGIGCMGAVYLLAAIQCVEEIRRLTWPSSKE